MNEPTSNFSVCTDICTQKHNLTHILFHLRVSLLPPSAVIVQILKIICEFHSHFETSLNV